MIRSDVKTVSRYKQRRPAVSVLLAAFVCAGSNVAAAKTHSVDAPRKAAGAPGQAAKPYKLDAELTRRSNDRHAGSTLTRVIVTLVPGAQLPAEFKKYSRNTNLDLINGEVLELPNQVLAKMATHPLVFRVHYDRPIASHNYRTGVTVGARTVQDSLGYTGAGIGVAIIDSGITSWHDDLTSNTSRVYPYGNQRVAKFVDFVNGRALPYDDNGHGSHVAGTIAGNGRDSNGDKAGMAPGASIVALKVLDEHGQGTISRIISALGWIAANARTHNIRVVNMSVGAGIHESYWTDPLTLATKKLTDRGITVVAAAGNLGKNAAGQLQYGGITAPGNAPWVLTVGASSTMGTLTRSDDELAGFSSAGPTFLDFEAKPDLVAPGVGTASLAVPGSALYITKPDALLDGNPKGGSKAYLSLSGTSMAAPVVTGTVALMLQANPNLTPNLIKALLQYTAQQYPGYNALRQGAGFLNTLGAVRLAKFYANPQAGGRMPIQKVWSRTIDWGSHRLTGGVIQPSANAWANNIVWGTAKTLGSDGDNIVWGTTSDGDNIVWGTTSDGDNIVWGTGSDGDNIVWGTSSDGDNIVWGTSSDGDNIVWGTSSDVDAPVIFSDDVVEPLPSLELEFGDVAPLAPLKPRFSTTMSVSIGG